MKTKCAKPNTKEHHKTIFELGETPLSDRLRTGWEKTLILFSEENENTLSGHHVQTQEIYLHWCGQTIAIPTNVKPKKEYWNFYQPIRREN